MVKDAARLTGPIRFLEKLLETAVGAQDAIPLLGLEHSALGEVTNLMNGRVPLEGRDADQRVAFLFRIRKTLSALFQNEDIENQGSESRTRR